MPEDEVPEYTAEDRAAWMALLGYLDPGKKSLVNPDPECFNCVQLHALFSQFADYAGDTIACALHSFKFGEAEAEPEETCHCRCKRPKGKCGCCDESLNDWYASQNEA